MTARRILLVLFLAPALFAPGCKCIRTPSSMRAEEDMHKKLKEDLAQRDEPQPSASASAAGPGVFDVETRMESLRESFTAQHWESVKHDGLALVTAGLDEITKLEVLMMLIEAMRQTQDRERSREFSEQFNKLYAELKDSERLKAAGRDRERITGMVAKLKAKAGTTDRFAEPEGEARTSFKLAEKLRAGSANEVMEHTLDDGGTIHFSKSPEALESKVGAGSPVQRDPEFDYYYSVQEAPLPPGAPGEKKTR